VYVVQRVPFSLVFASSNELCSDIAKFVFLESVDSEIWNIICMWINTFKLHGIKRISATSINLSRQDRRLSNDTSIFYNDNVICFLYLNAKMHTVDMFTVEAIFIDVFDC
jgi:hypothetical protein